ncbi:hypothetical protein BH09BAC2_BH09BAC2_15390 [soil metagenome]
MIKSIRESFNHNFSESNYKIFLQDLDNIKPGALAFRVAETPVFINKELTSKIINACESIVDVITAENFKNLTEGAIPINEKVPHENDHTHFIAFDFGICENDRGEIEPQLIEMQGFPSLFALQAYYPELIRKHYDIPANFDNYLNGYNKETYIELLKDIILRGNEIENVILLEIKPHEQKTRIDFYCTHEYLQIPIVCITELLQKGNKLFYKIEGRDIEIKRIYNRIIFDELQQQKKSLPAIVDITQELDVEWVPHPNWFYRISKYTLPFIHHPYIPETFFLNDVKQLSGTLDEYVLKPLFSFAGQGVIIDVTDADIESITDPENWILQRKVKYADIIATPDGPAKAEVRIFYFWKDGWERPVAVNNLARLSKGKMIGVRYNADKTWVGGSVAFFESKIN